MTPRIEALLSAEVQQFIKQNESADITRLLLSGRSVGDVSATTLSDQILSRRKAKNKLPHWYGTEGIIFPPPLSLEQASSLETGRYKTALAGGNRLLDMTGGMGVDTSFFSQSFEQVIYVEKQQHLVEVFRHNMRVLGLKNVEAVHSDGTDYVTKAEADYFDMIYIDPARRNPEAKKVHAIEDCEPDIARMRSLLLRKAGKILVKLSPMLDITHTIKALECVSEVHVVAVRNECKELLVIMERDPADDPLIRTVNVDKNGNQLFDFRMNEERAAQCRIGEAQAYLYEPNAALLKAGAFRLPADRLGLTKLDHHTHLYTSDQLKPDFPGKVYRIETVFGAQKKEISRRLRNRKVSVKTRNFPLSPDAIRKKYSLSDGEESFVFFCQVDGKKTVLDCTKV